MRKRILSVFLAVVLVMGLIPGFTLTSMAEEIPTGPTIGTVEVPSAVLSGTDLNATLTAPAITANGFGIITKGWVSSADGINDWSNIPIGSISTAAMNGYYLQYYVVYSDSVTKNVYSPNTVQLTVNRYAPTLGLSVTPDSPQSAGTKITLTATISGGSSNINDQNYLNTVPVTFKDGTTTLDTAIIAAQTGKATYSFSPSAGNHTFTAEFPGDTGYNAAATSDELTWQSTTAPPTDWNGIIPTSDPGFAYSGGSGTEASPYLIGNSYDLAMLASNVNTTTGYSIGIYFKMTADIDLNPGIAVTDATTTAKEWTPIGNYYNNFKGTFDGGGFAVKGMYLKDITGLWDNGLFGTIKDATIKNLGVTDSFVNIINISNSAAGIIGFAYFSTVENCYNTAKINGYASVGGVVGTSSGSTVKNCYNTGEISGTDAYVGGVVGQAANTTIVQDCYNTGNISGKNIVGGIVGYIHNTSDFSASAMYRCYNIGNVVAAVSSSYNSLSLGGSGIAGLVTSWTSTMPNKIVPLDSCVSLGLSVSATTIYVPNTTTRVAKGNGAISNSYARSDLKVINQLIYNGTKTNEHGQNLTVAQNTAQDWSTWFGTMDTSVWEFPTDGKLWYGAQLPTLKGVGGIQNPRLPGTGTGATETYTVTYNGNGATSGSVTSQTTNVGTATTVAANGFNKTGYTFNGWNTMANGNGTAYASGGTVPSQTAGSTIALYAQWLQDAPPSAQTYGVAYNGNGATSGSVTSQTTNVGTATTVAANGFTKTGYTFAGWNTAASGSGTAYGAGSTVPSQAAGSTVTLYAQWTEITYAVSGTVKDNNNANVDGASVKLMQGNTQIGNTVTTGADGAFLIMGVPNGKYNLVVEKDGIIVTTLITVSNGDYASGTIQLPVGRTNSVVEVTGSDTPKIVVSNLDGQFSTPAKDNDNDKGVTSEDNDVVTSGGSVEIKLTATQKDSNASNAGNISATATTDGKTVGIFIDLSVRKTVKDSGGSEITSQSAILTELSSLIDVYIPLPVALQGKSSYTVYRYHGSAVDTITTEENSMGEKLELIDNNTTIKFTVSKFSTYAIAYTASSSSSSGGNKGSSSTSSAITAEQSEGGKIIISDGKKTVSITPDDGYIIADVLVDGKSIGETGKYTVADSKAHKISAVFVKETELPYYSQNDGRIYIGFSAIAEDLYKYIAPTGVTVEFRENPKNFKDNTIAWAKPSIDFVTERELFLGTSQDTFSPNESMTRAMFVTVIGRLYERSYGSISGASTFSDVDANAYYAKYVAWANENGIIKGIGENQFAPEVKVTREQMAVIMRNFADFLNKADIADSYLAYADSASISSWAMDGAKYCQETKVITGRDGGSFAPQESATRAEVAAVIERFIKTIVE